jgi:hypothetical protein
VHLAYRVGSRLGPDLVQPPCDQSERLVPGRFTQLPAFPISDLRHGQAIGVVDEAVRIPALDAKLPLADWVAFGR